MISKTCIVYVLIFVLQHYLNHSLMQHIWPSGWMNLKTLVKEAIPVCKALEKVYPNLYSFYIVWELSI